MKKIITAIILSGLCTLTFAQSSVKRNQQEVNIGSKAQIIFDETEFDFGKAIQGDIIKHDFQFTNTGTDPLIITSVHGSCGGCVPTWQKEPIMPGKKGCIITTLSLAGKLGCQNKTFTVVTNTKSGIIVLHLKGGVLAKGNPFDSNNCDCKPKLKTQKEDIAQKDSIIKLQTRTVAVIKQPLVKNKDLIKSSFVTVNPVAKKIFNDNIEEDLLEVNAAPNPASDQLKINFNKLNAATTEIRLFDLTGKKVLAKTVSQNSLTETIDVSSLLNGIYLMPIIADDKIICTKKIIISH